MLIEKLKLFCALYLPSAILITIMALPGVHALGLINPYYGYGGVIFLGLVVGVVTGVILLLFRFKPLYIVICTLFPILSLIVTEQLLKPAYNFVKSIPSHCTLNYIEYSTTPSGFSFGFVASGKGNEMDLLFSDLIIEIINIRHSKLKVSLIESPVLNNHGEKRKWSQEELIKFYRQYFTEEKERTEAADLVLNQYKYFKSARSKEDLKNIPIPGNYPPIRVFVNDNPVFFYMCAAWHVQAISLIGAFLVISSFFSVQFRVTKEPKESNIERKPRDWEKPSTGLTLGEARCPDCRSKYNYINNEGLLVSTDPNSQPKCSRCGKELKIPI